MSETPYSSNHYVDPTTPPDLPQHLMQAPSAIKAFGVLHVILASLGLFCFLGGMGLFFSLPTVLSPLKDSGKEQEVATVAYLEQLLAHNQPLILAHFACAIILVTFLFIAGIGLLKKKEIGRTASVIYAILSITSKVIIGVISWVYFSEANDRITANFVLSQGGNVSSGQNAFSSILSIIFQMIYPVLTLILLSSSKVKEFLRNR